MRSGITNRSATKPTNRHEWIHGGKNSETAKAQRSRRWTRRISDALHAILASWLRPRDLRERCPSRLRGGFGCFCVEHLIREDSWRFVDQISPEGKGKLSWRIRPTFAW